MILSLSVFLTVLFIVALILTLKALKKQEEKAKLYQEMEHSFSDELKRSHEYEATSIKEYLPIQIWIYSIATILSFVLVLIYIYK